MNPTDEQALQFAIMLQAGLPAKEAILYFYEEENDPVFIATALAKWTRSRAVKRAQLKLMRKPWQEMTTDERMHYALDQHYSSLAYVLFSANYLEASQSDKAKLDTARSAIEAKLAGTAGKVDSLTRFFDDVSSGKVKLLSKPS